MLNKKPLTLLLFILCHLKKKKTNVLTFSFTLFGSQTHCTDGHQEE